MNLFRWPLLPILIVMAGLPVCGIARPILTFVKPTDLPELGIQLKLMPGAREVPPASPSVCVYQFNRGGETWKEDRFSPLELWRQGQYAGQWVGHDDNKLLLAFMSRLPPDVDPGQHVTQAVFEQQSLLTTNVTRFATEADLTRWVAGFTGCPHPLGKRLNKQFSRISPVWVYLMEAHLPNRVAYVFRLARGAGKASASTWVCAQFDLNPEIRMDTACEIIEREFLGSISTITMTQPVVRETLTKMEKGLVDSDSMAVSRQQVLNSIRNLKGWWYDVTPDYIILSNLKGGSGSLVEQLKGSMKAIRSAYKQCIPEPEAAGIGVIRIPATQLEYREYVGEESGWTQGLWMPARKELVICPAADQGSHAKRESILRVAFHEGFHQYAFYALGQANASMWFNEGYAQFFENASLSNGRLTIEESPRVLSYLNKMQVENRMDLRRLFKLTREAFYDPNEKVRLDNYILSWALVYYLKKDVSCLYPGLLDKYVAAMLRNGGNAEIATDDMLEGVDLRKLQSDFQKFWQSTSRQSAARRKN